LGTEILFDWLLRRIAFLNLDNESNFLIAMSSLIHLTSSDCDHMYCWLIVCITTFIQSAWTTLNYWYNRNWAFNFLIKHGMQHSSEFRKPQSLWKEYRIISDHRRSCLDTTFLDKCSPPIMLLDCGFLNSDECCIPCFIRKLNDPFLLYQYFKVFYILLRFLDLAYYYIRENTVFTFAFNMHLLNFPLSTPCVRIMLEV
jgi:hypothetical protein